MGVIEFHLEYDFFCDINGFICFSPHKYIYNMIDTYITMFGSNQKLNKAFRDPLGNGYHPDIEIF